MKMKMPHVKKRLASALVLLSLAMVLRFPCSAADSGIPPVSLGDAVLLAKEFLRTNTIDTAQHQMLTGTLGRYPGGANYWELRWSPTNKTVKDGFIDLRIDMDRTVTHLIHAEDLSISLALPVLGDERPAVAFDRHSHFHVILSNPTKEPRKIATEWNSWGYDALTFEITHKSGRKSVARRVAIDRSKNTLTWWTLQPQESVVLDVYFADPEKWEGFPRFERYGESETVTLRASFEYFPEERKPWPDGFWRGRVVSEPKPIVFYSRVPEKK